MPPPIPRKCRRKINPYLWIPSLLSIFAAAASAYATWKAYEVAERQSDDFRNRIEFHFKLIDRETWSIRIYQIAGETYHLPRVHITPTFEDSDGNFITGKPISKPLQPQIDQTFIYYELLDLQSALCATDDQCEIAALDFSYKIYNRSRSGELP